MRKSYVKIMLEQETIIAKVGESYFGGFNKDRFIFTDNTESAYIFKDRDEFISLLVILNYEYSGEVSLLHLDENNKFVQLEIYNNFIKAEMQIEAEKYGKRFQNNFTEFLNKAKFYISFNVNGEEMWVKEYPTENVKTVDKITKYLTCDFSKAIEIDFKLLRERKRGDSKNVESKVLDILETTKIEFIEKPHKIMNEAFYFAFEKEIKRQITEERISNNY